MSTFPESPASKAAGLPRAELDAALAARRELGPDYDDAFAETVAERIQEVLEGRRTRPASPPPSVAAEQAKAERAMTLTIAVVSMVTAIPLTAIAANVVGFEGLLTVWICLTVINVAFALRRH